MRFSLLSVSLLAASLVAATTDFNDVLKDIAEISADTKTLTTTVSGFKGGDISTALKIQHQSNEVLSDTKHAATHAHLSKPFGEDGSLQIGVAILDLQPVIYDSLEQLINKKPQFDQKIAGITPSKIALKSLQDLKKASDKFGAYTAEKLSEPYKSLAPGIQKDIDDHFDAAIKVFSS